MTTTGDSIKQYGWKATPERPMIGIQGQPLNPDRFIAITRARLIARYKMHTNGPKTDELETNHPIRGHGKRIVSIAYAGGEMRIRKHGGPTNREWVSTRDFRLRDGWLGEVYEYLDRWMDYHSIDMIAKAPATFSPLT